MPTEMPMAEPPEPAAGAASGIASVTAPATLMAVTVLSAATEMLPARTRVVRPGALSIAASVSLSCA